MVLLNGGIYRLICLVQSRLECRKTSQQSSRTVTTRSDLACEPTRKFIMRRQIPPTRKLITLSFKCSSMHPICFTHLTQYVTVLEHYYRYLASPRIHSVLFAILLSVPALRKLIVNFVFTEHVIKRLPISGYAMLTRCVSRTSHCSEIASVNPMSRSTRRKT